MSASEHQQQVDDLHMKQVVLSTANQAQLFSTCSTAKGDVSQATRALLSDNAGDNADDSAVL